jgi:hypothetical protein
LLLDVIVNRHDFGTHIFILSSSPRDLVNSAQITAGRRGGRGWRRGIARNRRGGGRGRIGRIDRSTLAPLNRG